MKPGELLQEGVVVRHTEQGVYVGREAKEDEALPVRHTEHLLNGRRVFLSNDQGPILPAILHPKRSKKRGR